MNRKAGIAKTVASGNEFAGAVVNLLTPGPRLNKSKELRQGSLDGTERFRDESVIPAPQDPSELRHKVGQRVGRGRSGDRPFPG